MKTIEELAEEFSNTHRYLNTKIAMDQGFINGAKFVQRWIHVDECLPEMIPYRKTGERSSEFVLVKDRTGWWGKAILCERCENNIVFTDWYNEDGFELSNPITEWRPINYK